MQIFYLARMEMPELLIEAFDGDRDLRAWAGTLRGSWQKAIAVWVMEPKGKEARQRRCAQMAERLLQTMEAEQELPPLLAQRFRRTKDAIAGWENLTLSCRREFLMAIFGARREEAREKQIIKMVEVCSVRGSKKLDSSNCIRRNSYIFHSITVTGLARRFACLSRGCWVNRGWFRRLGDQQVS